MSQQFISCPMCGFRFDPAQHTSCDSCPLKKGCNLVCCPACGYETVDPTQSSLAKAATILFSRLKRQPAPEGKG